MNFSYLFLGLCGSAALANPVILCDVSQGLDLINRDNFSITQVEMILSSCDKVSPNNPSVLLLHGLLARKNKQNEVAIQWLEKARAISPDDQTITLELAVTYELTSQLAKAQQLYQLVLSTTSQNRAALLGLARIYRLKGDFIQANEIYQTLLIKNSQDVDALNGLGWIKVAQNDLTAATTFFNDTLAIQPQNAEASDALNKIKQTQLQQVNHNQTCDVMNGLSLLNQKNPPITQIKAILAQCELNKIDNNNIQLLHGLVARQLKNYKEAIYWFQRATQSAEKNNYNPKLELAVTYEWAQDPKKAILIYRDILIVDPSNRAAILGSARAFRALKKFDEARSIYNQLLTTNTKDFDAYNGLGWLALAQQDTTLAQQFFKKSLSVQPTNAEALLGLKNSEIPAHPVVTPHPVLCDADNGLILMNSENPPLDKIKDILIRCDKNTPNNTSALLLHGLLARHIAQQKNQDYGNAIAWLLKASQSAAPGNDTPKLELAVTYEWAGDYKQALLIYNQILAKAPNTKAALLGKARTLNFSYQIGPALALYKQLLIRYPNDIAVLSGQGETYMANYEFKKARENFNQILSKHPTNKQALSDLDNLNKSTKNLLDLSIGHYTVPPNSSDGLNLYYFRNLNATDGLTLLATHNTKQIQSGFGVGSSLLPNDSLLVGYQRNVPNKYGWQVSYDARDHHGLPFEHRLFGSTNIYLQRNLEWFGGARFAFPSVWNTQLLISGFNIHTSLPVDVRVTGFWSFQAIGGFSSSYSLDFSKELNNHLFYDIGPSYLVEQKSWEAHGRLILPVFKNQALVVQASHYIFNNSTFLNAGWRVYWA